MVAVPGLASAADAPVRAISFDTQGNASRDFVAVAVRDDGTEVAGYLLGKIAIRDVAAGRTTLLPIQGSVVDASDDLGTLLIDSTTSYSPADTGAYDDDLYLFDRASGRTTLVSREADGTLGVARPGDNISRGELSNDGKVVTFQQWHIAAGSTSIDPTVDQVEEDWRYERATGTLRHTGTVAKPSNVTGILASRDGNVTVDAGGVNAGSKHYPLPTASNEYWVGAWVAPDGSTVVFRERDLAVLKVLRTADGSVTSYGISPTIARAGFKVWGAVGVGTDNAVIGYTVNPSTTPKGRILVVGPSALSEQQGGDIPLTVNTVVNAVTPNRQFAASNAILAALGSAPLPGTDPVVPSNAKALDYVDFTDAGCINNIFFITWTRARIALSAGPRGTDLRTPATAKITVIDDDTYKVSNAFTLSAGQARDLVTGRNGGFTYIAKVTFTNGTSLLDLRHIAAHPTPTCPLIL